MNRYASLKNQKSTRLSAAAALALCVLLTSTMLFSRLVGFSPADTTHYIPLTRSGGLTQVTETGARAAVPSRVSVLAVSPILAADWFQTSDHEGVWEGRTDIEIFRVSYDNEAGEMTVHSAAGDKVIAPGTRSEYAFALKNTGRETVEYAMSMEAYFTDGTYTIPVNARVTDTYGNYYAGTAEEMADVLALNQVSDSGTLKAGYVMPYTLEWEWPFEEDDAYDTMLGNLAVEEDISLTIVIKTVASYTTEPGGGEPPKTGDESNILFFSLAMAGSLIALVVLLSLERRKQEDAEYE